LFLPAPIETFSRIFYECPCVEKLVKKFFGKFLDIPIDKKNYFSGFYCENTDKNKGISILINCFRYCIWQTRLLKLNISYTTIENETSELLQIIIDGNAKIKHDILFNEHIILGGRPDPNGEAHQEWNRRQREGRPP
jgi:hypothetical protein